MSMTRRVKTIYSGRPTLEGAGVRLNRIFGHNEVPTFDPFLLLDDFHSRNPKDYMAGFPWHPHRGIETVTYMTRGRVEHGDSLGNSGIIGPGDMQWMTAGSGIIHQEMPKAGENGHMGGLQLWVNLPADQKMMPPRYREVRSGDIPVSREKNGVSVKVISGRYGSLQGPVRDIIVEPEYFDVAVASGQAFMHEVAGGHTVLAYVLEGQGLFSPGDIKPVGPGHLVLYDPGTEVRITGARDALRFLLISGKPLGEPVAWYGPIVMNTREELQLAFEEYRSGTFIKHDQSG
jgi:redox-sensitive bicupin YhaK (pirin superfamily)